MEIVHQHSGWRGPRWPRLNFNCNPAWCCDIEYGKNTLLVDCLVALTLVFSWLPYTLPDKRLHSVITFQSIFLVQAFIFIDLLIKTGHRASCTLLRPLQAYVFCNVRLSVAGTEKGKSRFPCHAYAFTGGFKGKFSHEEMEGDVSNHVFRGIYRNHPWTHVSASESRCKPECAFPHICLLVK